jgi:putative nucleotidyltransferase with HDIG domain
MLSIMLCKSLSMIEADAKAIGLAAIFHDIGKAKISDAILLKETPLDEEELAELRKHCEYGAQMAKESGLSDRISKVILQHHEYADGSGYPQQLTGSDIDPLARLIAIVSGYDNLCNPQHGGHALTPYEALSHMFSHQRSKFDEWILKQFIKSLGVYPPGSVVQLSNGAHAIVISVNPHKPLKPFVMVHDPDRQRETPLVIDLREEPALTINLCLRPHQLPPESLIYLNPRQRVSYFVDKDLAVGRSQQ